MLDEKQGYHSFSTVDGIQFGSFEVFFMPGDKDWVAGWYWWACFPGCIPDGEAVGPFETSTEAYRNAI